MATAPKFVPYDGEIDPATAVNPVMVPYDGKLEGEKDGVIRRAADVGLGLAKGAIGISESALGLADIATGGRAGKALENEGGMLGYRPKEAKAYLDSLKSDDQKAADAAVQASDGFLPTVGAMLENPSTIVGSIAESAPSMFAGGLVGRGLGFVAPKVGAVARGAAGEAIMGAGSSAEQIRQETADGRLTPGQSALAAGSGALTGAIGYGAGRLANRLGIGDVDTMIAGGTTKVAGAAADVAEAGAQKGLLRKVGEGVLTEGVLEEAPQSGQEQIAQNLALGKPWDEGVGSAVGAGTLVGGFMGGGAAGLGHLGSKPAPAPESSPFSRSLGLPAPDAGPIVVGPDGTAATPAQTVNAANERAERDFYNGKPGAGGYMGAAPTGPVSSALGQVNPEVIRPTPPPAAPEPGTAERMAQQARTAKADRTMYDRIFGGQGVEDATAKGEANPLDSLLDPALPWDAPAEVDDATFLAQLGFSNDEVNDAIAHQSRAPDESGAGRAGAAPAGPGNARPALGYAQPAATFPRERAQEVAPAPAAPAPAPAAPAPAPAAPTESAVPAVAFPVVVHTTAKGKELRGTVRKGLTLAQAKAIDGGSFITKDGAFIRERAFDKLAAFDAAQGVGNGPDALDALGGSPDAGAAPVPRGGDAGEADQADVSGAVAAPDGAPAAGQRAGRIDDVPAGSGQREDARYAPDRLGGAPEPVVQRPARGGIDAAPAAASELDAPGALDRPAGGTDAGAGAGRAAGPDGEPVAQSEARARLQNIVDAGAQYRNTPRSAAIGDLRGALEGIAKGDPLGTVRMMLTRAAERLEGFPVDQRIVIEARDALTQPDPDEKQAAAPKPTYAQRRVAPRSVAALTAWAKAQGFTSVVADMHVTIAYSKAPVDRSKVRLNGKPLFVPRLENRAVKKLGEATVLTISPKGLKGEWQAWRDAGASWDYDGYTPHITITYEPGNVDLSKVQTFIGPIELMPMEASDLDEDAAENVAEKDTGAAPQPEKPDAVTPAPAVAAPAPAPEKPDAVTPPKAKAKEKRVRVGTNEAGAPVWENKATGQRSFTVNGLRYDEDMTRDRVRQLDFYDVQELEIARDPYAEASRVWTSSDHATRIGLLARVDKPGIFANRPFAKLGDDTRAKLATYAMSSFNRFVEDATAIDAGLREEEEGRQEEAAAAAQEPAAAAQEPAEQRAAFAEAERKRRAAGDAARSRAWTDNPFRAFLGKHGIALSLANEWAPGQTERRQALVQGYGPIFRKAGMQLDALAEVAKEEGFLRTASVTDLEDLIGRAMRKERVAPLYAEGVAEDEAEAIFNRQREMEEEAAAALQDLEAEELADIEDFITFPAPDRAEPTTDEAILEALGVPLEDIPAVIAEAGARAQSDGAGSARAGEADPDEAEAFNRGREDAPGLVAPTRDEVVARQDAAAAAERDAAAKKKAEQDRLAADAAVGEFTLTGSDRPADADPRQGSMFDAPAESPAPAAKAPAAPAKAPAPVPPVDARFANNKLVTADAMAAARARMKAKLGRLNSGIDPELLMDGMTLTVGYIEGGVRTFSAYSKQMLEDFGDAIKPYLLSFYEGARHYPGADPSGMTKPEAAAKMHAEMLTEMVREEAAEVLGEQPAVEKKRPKPGAVATLVDDYGVEHIDGYDSEYGEGTGAVKTQFLKDTRTYLTQVSKALADAGWAPHRERNGKDGKAVSVNESGMAGSGDVSLTMKRGNVGVYLTIGDTSLRGMVPMTKSGIAIMGRFTNRPDEDRFASSANGGTPNQWLPVNLNATEMADWVIQRAEKVPARPGTVPTNPAPADNAVANDEPTSPVLPVDRAGPPALAGAPAGDGRAPGAGRDPGGNAPALGAGDLPGDGRGDGSGLDVAGSLGASPGAVPVPAGGNGPGRGNAGRRGVSSAGGARSGARPSGAVRGGLTPPAGPNPAPNAPPIAPPQITAADFTLEDDFALGAGGQKAKFKGNVAAIRLVADLDASGRMATPAEQRVLAGYVGWGGLPQAFDAKNADWAKEHAELVGLMSPEDFAAAARSTRYAHYTSRPVVVDGVYAALTHFGFTGGKTLEAGAGVGNFLGLMPPAMRSAGRFTAIEREPFSSSIARQLYPQQIVLQEDFTAFKGNDAYFDAAVGNPPFASDPQVDKSGRKHLSGLSLHNYFFAKAVDMLREGGILAQVVTNSFLDAKGDKARTYIADRTVFLGAIRLPNSAFSKNAGTEVTTDIIFLQKRADADVGSKAAKADAQRWLNTAIFTDKNGKQVALNRYFIDNPEMMLGEFGAFGTMYGPEQAALVARDGQDTAALLKAAVARLPANVYTAASASSAATAERRASEALRKPTVNEGGYFMDGDRLMQRDPDLGGEARASVITPETLWSEKLTLGNGGYDALKRLSSLRVTLRDLIAAEMADDKRMKMLRARLNTEYDAFQKEHGFIHGRATKRVFEDDPDYPLLLSLENGYTPAVTPAAAKKAGIEAKKATARKAAIFNQRVVAARAAVAKVETPADALAVSMAERGRLDTAYIGELLGRDPEGVLEELSSGDKPLLFRDPATDEFVLRDAYLSGNVRAKLAQANAAGMFANARALEAVQPKDVPAAEISVRLGSPWVPTSVYQDFAVALYGEGTKARISYLPINGSFAVDIRPGNQIAFVNTWGTPRVDGEAILTALLNNKTIKVTYKDRDGTTHTDGPATEAAADKSQELKQKFTDWVFKDGARSAMLVRAYNDTNNNYVKRTYDAGLMTFPGKVPDKLIAFRRHQRNAIARTVQDRTALYDHTVGSGKTFTTIAAVMELKRTGLARKSMVAVPNHLVKQWASDFYRLYPGANVLTATKKDFEKANRRKFLARIATGDWDAVVIAHSSFGFIKAAPDFEADFNQRQIKEVLKQIALMEAEPDSPTKKRTVKQLEGIKERMENRIAALRDKPMDDLLDFQQIGVDQLFVDEAHMFKNLFYTTKMTGVAGMQDPAGSQRAYDMYLKTQQIMAQNGRGQGVVFATGTPVSNSLGEMYHMMRYLMPRQMEELGFASFDAWANTYASVDQVWMQKPSGDGFKATNRMSNFVNTPELLKLFDQVSDTVTMEDVKAAYREENGGKEFPLPKVKTGRRQPVSMDKTPSQTAYMQDIAKRAAIVEQRKGPPMKGDDNVLVIMGDARKAAMDIRLVDPTITEREPGSRIDLASRAAFERYKKYDAVRGTQLVFSDMGTPLKNAKAELKEYAELQAIIARATEEVQASATLGDERAMGILEDAEAAQAKIDDRGKDWLGAMKAAERGFSIYDDFKAAMVEMGVPANEVAFIHDYNTDDQKADLFRKVNAGQIRILLGSTAKMGAGTNVQERLVALHHLDVPWRPSDVEQREGRIERQGNELYAAIEGKPDISIPGFEVEILAYVTRDTLDMRMWQVQEVKLKMINQLRTRTVEREIDNAFEDMEMSAGEMQAAATGDMDLLRNLQLAGDIKKLEQRQRSFDNQKNELAYARERNAQLLRDLPGELAKSKPLAERSRAYAAEQEQRQDALRITIDGKTYERQEARDVLHALDKAREEVTDLAGEVTQKAAPIKVNIEGEDITSRVRMAQAFTEVMGDNAPITWAVGGTDLHSRNAIEKAIGPRIADALADEKVVDLGTIAGYEVQAEGNVTPKGNFLDVTMRLNGEVVHEFESTPMGVVGAVENRALNAVRRYEYDAQMLEQAKRQKADLDATKDQGEWPEAAKLEDLRAQQKKLLAKLRGNPLVDKARIQALAAWAKGTAVKNPDGSPMVVYHGTVADFDTFDAAKSGASTDAGFYGPGFYFANDPAVASRYAKQKAGQGDRAEGGRVMPVYLAITKPYITTEQTLSDEELARIKAEGYDGIISNAAADQGYTEYVAFRPEQVKSATGNSGKFDPANPSILADVRPVGDNPDGTKRAPSVKRAVRSLLAQVDKGTLTPEQFADQMGAALDAADTKAQIDQIEGLGKDRTRGADYIRERLLQAKRRGELDAEAVAMAEWFIQQNPGLLDDLGISIVGDTGKGSAGTYNPLQRLMRLAKGGGGDTIVHEMLHHLERMMPRDIQRAIRKAWARDFARERAAAEKSGDKLRITYFAALAEYHFGDGDARGIHIARVLLEDGSVPYSDYQFFNPSEYWAVNGSRIVGGRFDASRSIAMRIRNWLAGLVQKLRAVLGLRSDAPIIAALDSLARADGKFQTSAMLSRAGGGIRDDYDDYADVQPANMEELHNLTGPATAYARQAQEAASVFFNTPGKSSWWHKTVGSPYNLAQRNEGFRKVFDRVQTYIKDVSRFATVAADMAPRILPQLNTLRDLGKSPLSAANTKAVSRAMFEGTLAWTRDAQGRPVKTTDPAAAGMGTGIQWKPAELKSILGFTDEQVSLYREGRQALNRSLSDLALSDALRFAGQDGKAVAHRVMSMIDPQPGGTVPSAERTMAAMRILEAHLQDLAVQDPARATVLNDTAAKVMAKAGRAVQLMAEGYAPLSRFGRYTLDIVQPDGTRAYFGLFENPLERSKMAKQMAANFPGAKVTQGTMSQESHKLFQGVTPETVELFGEMLGLEAQGGGAAAEAFQQYLKAVKGNRSAMKRLIERKGIAGYNEDFGRVLAGFITSNARQASGNLHTGDVQQAANDIDRNDGEVKDAAVRLVKYVSDPQEEAGRFRGWLFAQYIGGSIASAMVNLTQPLQTTLPYLSQFGGIAGAGKQLQRAMVDALNPKFAPSRRLDLALKRAEELGITLPQEIHALQGQAMGKAVLRAGDGTRLGDTLAMGNNAFSRLQLGWGKLFSTAESTNRRITFIAAFRLAEERGDPDPFGFAERAINETQFVANKGNRPRWARGAVGATLFTFKSYSVNYIELVARMATAGKPGSPERAAGQKAAALALATLFLMGGAGGLPFAEDIGDLIDGLMQRLGYNFDTKAKRVEFLESLFGRAGAQFVEQGVSGISGMPVDLSGRMGMGNLIPGTGFLTKKADYGRDTAELFGPAGDFVKRAATSAGQVVEGEPVKALFGIAPKAVGNLRQAADMATTGMYRDQRGKKVLDTNGYEALAKGIGFQPASVARVQEATFTQQNLIAQAKMASSAITDKWAQGIALRDPDMVREAQEDLRDWNRKNPETPVRPTMQSIQKKAQTLRMDKAARIERTAPKAMRAEVRENLARELRP
jgi:N12 class adenine-specific DNA methylase